MQSLPLTTKKPVMSEKYDEFVFVNPTEAFYRYKRSDIRTCIQCKYTHIYECTCDPSVLTYGLSLSVFHFLYKYTHICTHTLCTRTYIYTLCSQLMLPSPQKFDSHFLAPFFTTQEFMQMEQKQIIKLSIAQEQVCIEKAYFVHICISKDRHVYTFVPICLYPPIQVQKKIEHMRKRLYEVEMDIALLNKTKGR